MLKSIHHVAIMCSNYAKSKDFYVNKFGLKIVNEVYRKEKDSYKLDLEVGGKYQIELFSFPDPPKRLTHPEACGLRHLAFEVDDVEKVTDELRQRGIEIEQIRIDPYTGKKFNFVLDPDGLPLEIYEK